jgi:hypothetical protein
MVLMRRCYKKMFGVLLLLVAGAAHARPESGDGVVRFVYIDAQAQEVYLVGDFNGWSPHAAPLDLEADATWMTEQFLDRGTYEYKLLVDGTWRIDADNPEVSPSGNSVVRVGDGGVVLPPRVTSPEDPGDPSDPSPRRRDLRWSVRYLGFFASRRDDELGRYDLERPEHDVDVRLEADFGNDVSGSFLMNFNNIQEGSELSRTTLRYDRGELLWRAPAFELKLFDNDAVVDFEDPGHLVGRLGIYDDTFGYRRRGVYLERRILGAPLHFVYSDNTEAPPDVQANSLLPASLSPGEALRSYEAVNSKRNADMLAVRFRAGRSDGGLGFGWRSDRGASPGALTEVESSTDPSAPGARGEIYDTTERWSGWSLDLRLRLLGSRLVAQYMSGSRDAHAHHRRSVEDSTFGESVETGARFELDDSRRAVVRLQPPSDRSDWLPQLQYDYQEHDFTARVSGTPFLMRRNSVELSARGRAAGVEAQIDAEQSWFDYPHGAVWETQFWFRRHNFWLDEDKARFDRMTLLGADRGSRLRLALSRPLWEKHNLHGSVRFTLSSPGFDRAPRYLETVLRFSVDVGGGLELRTHSRIATYRRFSTADLVVVDALGAGPHVEAGILAARDHADAEHDYRSFGSHFVELVYPLSERSDIALGFGVDPFVVYEVRNEYMDVGWDAFLFDHGASPADAFEDPVGVGQRLEGAERALERERRIMLEARVRF